MFTRVGGATLALIAAVALALSIAGGATGPLPGWWSGNPNVQGRLYNTKRVDTGLLQTRGCNLGAGGALQQCEKLPVATTVKITGYVAAGATGLLVLASMLLAIAAARQREGRKSLAKLVVFAVVVSGIVAIALIVQGPGIEVKAGEKLLNVSVPLGVGTYLFAAGMMSAIVASLLALRPTPPARRPLPRAIARQGGTGPAAAMHGQAHPVDVVALLQDDALRPAALGPEPRFGGRPIPPTPPPGGGYPTGAFGPAPSPAGQPLFSAAPQLRPLYEAAPNLGGTGGFVPAQQATWRMRPPTPIPRDQISAIAGIPTPPAFDAAAPAPVPPSGGLAFADTMSSLPVDMRYPQDPPLPSAAVPIAAPHEPSSRRVSTALGAPPAPPPPIPAAAGEPRTKTLPPPLRNKSVSTAPPFAIPPRTSAPMPAPPGPPRTSAPMPAPAAIPSPSPARAGKSAPIPRPAPHAGSGGVRPAPAVPFPSSQARLATRASTDPLDRLSTQAFEDETQERERHEDSGLARLRVEGDATGRTEVPPDFESARAMTDADDLVESHPAEKLQLTDMDLPLVKPPPAPAESDDAAPPADLHPAADPPATDDDAQPKHDRLARGLRAFGIKPTARDSTGMFKLSGAQAAGSPDAPERPETSPLIPPPAPAAAPATAAASAAASSASTTGSSSVVKVPISTAPTSLPPPSEKQSASSGPSPACPQCEAPMAWVEAHLRFYCKSCKMYF